VARIACFAPDLFFASKIEETLTAAGHEVHVLSEAPSEFPTADLVIADLMAIDAESVGGRGVPTLGFYRHTDPAVKERAEAAGFDLVVPRSRMAREMSELVAGLTEAG
jgi:hypothetical protein